MPTNTKPSAEEIQSGLAQFYGSDQFYRHWTGRIQHTEGVQYLAEAAGAHWLVDVVASYQHDPRINKCQGFQIWELTVNLAEHTGVVTLRADKDTPVLITQELEYTDFPLESIKLYLADFTLMLPTEY